MEASFWHNCWKKNTIGFHQDAIHPFLKKEIASLMQSTDNRVFVPLCGKSLDMFFWAEHMAVVGCELSEIACQDFFKDHDLAFQAEENGQFVRYKKDEITLLQGNIFNLSPQILGEINWIYDRAALIALPKTIQMQYVEYLKSLLIDGVKLALITLEFPEEELTGPPFPVFDCDVRRRFADYKINCVAEHDVANKQFARRTFDVSYLKERLYIIEVND